MLLKDERFDAETREQLEMICRNVELETWLIDDLLDVTRIEVGKVELDRRPIELGAAVRRVTETCKPDAAAKNLEMVVDLPSSPLWVKADPARLQQIVWNVIKNAIKFTPEGSVVRVIAKGEEAGFALVQVIDSGIGIEPSRMGRIFNAFEQADETITPRFGGIGVGLTISKALVELHGGTISVRSDGEGKGATFDVRLPLAAPESAAVKDGQPDASATADLISTEEASRSMRILLVEDHADTARVMARLLRSQGHQVTHASDVATSSKLLSENKYDLLISDLGLPDGNGWEIMRGLRGRGSNLPGIALSGYGQDADIQNSLEAGFCAHFTKPVNISALMAKIREVA
jgi:two-component system CheB/CheR fusion protein